LTRPAETDGTILRGNDVKPGGALEGTNQHLDDVRFVFNDENFFARGRAHDRQF
jgi:hypothetical protein